MVEEQLTPEMRAAVSTELRAAVDDLTARVRYARQHGLTFDTRRDLYEIFGYKRDLTVADFRARYERGGIAGRIVDALPKATWRNGVELVEDEKTSEPTTVFEIACARLFDRLNVSAKLMSVDILSRLSTYAVLLIGAEGDLTTELPKLTPGDNTDKLYYFTPFCGAGGPNYGNVTRTFRDALANVVQADAMIEKIDDDPSSPRFGLPTGYRLRRTDFNPSNDFSKTVVHWSRIIHVAEDCTDDEVYGKPALRLPWNDLDNLEKVTGGGSEAFFQRANQGRVWSIDAEANPSTEQLQDFREQIEKWEHGITRNVRTQGVTVDALGSDVANFHQQVDSILTLLSGTTGIPKRILTGSEMGELASSQDRDNWRDQVNGRRGQHAFPYLLKRLVDRLVDYGYLPKPTKYSARWGSVLNLTEEEKSSKATAWATINKLLKDAGMKPAFLMTELRDHCYEMIPYDDKVLDAEMREVEPVVVAASPTKGKFPRAAAEASLVEELAEAIAAGDVDAIDELIGLRRGE